MGAAEVAFVVVFVLRVGVPLFIPRFPLPAILTALVIDGVDQSVFQQFTDDDLAWYQGYDKALDVYYLSIGYLACVRNWADPFAFGTAQFLWYYRLAGVLLFELTGARWVLMVFPNTFEYVFIAYEAIRTAWNPRRLSHRAILGITAFIWIFIKLPQEWWIHVAQLDVTDILKEDILGVAVDTPWGTALSENLWFVALVLVVAIVATVAGLWAWRHSPPRDWRITVDVDAHQERIPTPRATARIPVRSWFVLEKVVLVSMISVIFAEVLPSTDTSPFQVAVGVGMVVVLNAALSHFLWDRGQDWRSAGSEFVATLILNLAIGAIFIFAMQLLGRDINVEGILFFLLLLTLIVTLFDRFHRRRFALERIAANGLPQAPA